MLLKQTIYTIVIVLLVKLPSAYSQQANPTDSLQRQIGLNLSPMLGYNERHLPWLDYRKFYKKDRALRVQAGYDGKYWNDKGETHFGDVSSPFSNTLDSTISRGPNESIFAMFRAGHLWYWNKGKDIYFVTGLEGQFKYTSTVTRANYSWERSAPSFNQTFRTWDKTKKWTHAYGIVPTFGIVWMPSSRFMLGVESGAGFFYGRSVTKGVSRYTTTTTFTTGPPTEDQFVNSRHVKSRFFEYGIDPLLGLIIGFRI